MTGHSFVSVCHGHSWFIVMSCALLSERDVFCGVYQCISLSRASVIFCLCLKYVSRICVNIVSTLYIKLHSLILTKHNNHLLHLTEHNNHLFHLTEQNIVLLSPFHQTKQSKTISSSPSHRTKHCSLISFSPTKNNQKQWHPLLIILLMNH